MKTTVLLIAFAVMAAMNLFTFMLMGADKRRARKGEWRVPERTLFLCAACFGALGGCVGMRVWRHKTKHILFRILFPLFLIAQIAAIVCAFLYLK